MAKTAIARLGLDRDRLPQVYAVGVKELWQLPPGRVNPGDIPYPAGERQQLRGLEPATMGSRRAPTSFASLLVSMAQEGHI